MKGPILLRTTGTFIFFFFSLMLYAQKNQELPPFKTVDADRDGRISYAEFYKGMDKTLLFEKWDSRQDGGLDRQELYDKIQERSLQAATAVVLEASYTGRMHEADFTSREKKEAEEMRLLNSFFRLADLNRDNRLNKAEFYIFIFRQHDADGNGSLILSEYDQESLQSLLRE